jgi:GAF domain-containing protein
VLVLGLFLGMSVIVGAVATQTGRRAAGSEQARSALADEQAALRRVATLVARQPSPAEVFAAVTEEAAKVLHLDNGHLVVYEQDQMATVVGSWNLRGPPIPAGTRVPLEGNNIIYRVFRTQQPARIDDYSDASGPVAEKVRAIGVHAAVGVPVLVGGRVWGVMAAGSSRPEPLPADTEMRIGQFTELVGTAIANTATRTELEQVAAEQAALGHVATLVTQAVPPGDVFTAVAAEVAGLFGAPHVGLFRYEREGMATVITAAGEVSSYLGRLWPCRPATRASSPRCSGPASRSESMTTRKSGAPLPRQPGNSTSAWRPAFPSSSAIVSGARSPWRPATSARRCPPIP